MVGLGFRQLQHLGEADATLVGLVSDLLLRECHAWLYDSEADVELLVQFAQAAGTDALVWELTMEEPAAGTNGMSLPSQERFGRDQVSKVLSLQLPKRLPFARAEGEKEVLVGGMQLADALDFEERQTEQLADAAETGPGEGLVSRTEAAVPEHDGVTSKSRKVIRDRGLSAAVAARGEPAGFHVFLGFWYLGK